MSDKEKAKLSVKKAQGTISKITEMIENEVYCPDIIQQVDAAIGLLKSTKRHLLHGHLDHCLETKLKENKNSTIEELIKIFNLGNK